MDKLDPRVAKAIANAIHKAIESVGIDGVRKMSMFPSSTKETVSFKIAA